MYDSRFFLVAAVNIPVALYILIVVFLILSALFSSAETAYSTCSKIRLKNYVEEGKKSSKIALHVAEDFEETLTTILIGNNIVNIGLTTLTATILLSIIANPTIANFVNTIMVTLIILIFGEIIPKTLAKCNAELLALKYAKPMYLLRIILKPINVLILPFKKLSSKISKNNESPYFTDDELETLIDTMEEEGTIEEDSANMMQAVLRLKERDVDEIMTPRVDCIMISINAEISELDEIFKIHQLSRIPVYENDKDNIVGKIHYKNYLLKKIENGQLKIEDLMSKPHYVPETMTVNDLIQSFRSNKEHMAIVTDQYGGTAGIVTLEDAFEMLIGEILDEYDEDTCEFLPIGNNKYVIHGDYNIDNLFDELDLPEVDTDYCSVSGFIYEMLEKYPQEGDIVKYECVVTSEELGTDDTRYLLEFEVLRVIERRILSVELKVSAIK